MILSHLFSQSWLRFCFMLMPCEECKFYLGNECWHVGNMNLGEQWEKIFRGCERYRTSINETLKPASVKHDPLWQELLELHKQRVQIVQERKRAIAILLKDIVASDFWDMQGIERPIMEKIIEPNLFDQFINPRETG
jgi:hypothetical protein